jgi:hypothetical protein
MVAPSTNNTVFPTRILDLAEKTTTKVMKKEELHDIDT